MVENLTKKEIFMFHRLIFGVLETESPDMSILELAKALNTQLINKLRIESVIKHNADRTAERG